MTLSAAWSRLSLRTKSLLVLSIPLIPLMAATGAILATARQQREAQRWVTHTLDVKAVISSAMRVTVDAEAAATELWWTRDAPTRERFDAAVAAWPVVSQQLLEIVQDNPGQVARAVRVRQLRDERPSAVLADYLVAHPDATRPPPDLMASSGRTLSEIGTQLADMQRVEDRLLNERGATLRTAEARVLRTAFLGATLGLIGGVICSLSFSRHVSRRIGEVGENAFRLVRHEPPAHLQPSMDEIGRLDGRLQELWKLTIDRMVALDRARAELDQFFSVSLDMLCVANLDGHFARLNPAWTAILGWDLKELIARPYADFIHPDDLETTARDAAAQAERSTIITVENRYRCKDGSYRWLSWKSISRPEFGLIFAAARDITEQKRTSVELQARVHELRELNNELEAFTYSVSHDLRTPLRHVTGFNGFIEKSATSRLNEQERRWLSQSISAAQRMGQLIDDLLAFSRMGRTPVARERVSLDAVVRQARVEASDVEASTGRIDWRIQPLPEIRGDANLLRHAFVNLFDNAIKYTRERPVAAIDVGTMAQRDGQAVIYVRDNGVGFDMQYAHKLFGVFQRLHAQDEFAGTGIGLANVRRIISRHGGQTWAEGVIGEGATFYLSLPLAQVQGEAAA